MNAVQINEQFTDREFEIISLMAEGASAKDIANHLFVSINTVTTHRKNILGKTTAPNTTALVAKCIRLGWI
jgi:DNA-binding CsgD family transcriptional regulator